MHPFHQTYNNQSCKGDHTFVPIKVSQRKRWKGNWNEGRHSGAKDTRDGDTAARGRGWRVRRPRRTPRESRRASATGNRNRNGPKDRGKREAPKYSFVNPHQHLGVKRRGEKTRNRRTDEFSPKDVGTKSRIGCSYMTVYGHKAPRSDGASKFGSRSEVKTAAAAILCQPALEPCQVMGVGGGGMGVQMGEGGRSEGCMGGKERGVWARRGGTGWRWWWVQESREAREVGGEGRGGLGVGGEGRGSRGEAGEGC